MSAKFLVIVGEIYCLDVIFERGILKWTNMDVKWNTLQL